MDTGDLRASDADRDRVAEILHTAYAAGRIDDQEHSERIVAAIRAKTLRDLKPLTADLVPEPAAGSPTPTVGPYVAALGRGAEEPDRITAALTEIKRTGVWRVRRRSYLSVFLGSVLLDLNQATFAAPEVELNLTQFLGSLTIRVPAGFKVRDETARVLGETSIKDVGEPDPRCPVVILRGTNVLGEIKVRGPKRGLLRKRVIA